MATGTGNLPYTMSPVSPFDVITSQAENERIANIESLADGTGIGDRAITSYKLDYTTLAFGNYSTSEVDTGFKWIDGKAIYKKTVDIGSLPNNTFKTVAHGVAGTIVVVDIYGFASSGTVDILLPYVHPTATPISLQRESGNIVIQTGANRSTYSGFATMLYTKTI